VLSFDSVGFVHICVSMRACICYVLCMYQKFISLYMILAMWGSVILVG
jgi:hypothetical protein